MITITQGDEVEISLRCPDHNLTGATLTTRLRKADDTWLELADGVHTKDADQTTNPGLFTLALTEEQTALLKIGRSTLVTKVEQVGTIRQFHGVDILLVRDTPFDDDEE